MNGFVGTAYKTTPNFGTGGGFGIKLARGDPERYFDRTWKTAFFDLEDGPQGLELPLTASFWNGKCCEVRSWRIGRWFLDHGLARWPHRQPPKFRVESVGTRRFAVHLPEARS